MVDLRILHAKNQSPRSKTVAYRPRTHTHTHTHRQTDRQTEKVNTEDPFFRIFFFYFRFSLKGAVQKFRKKGSSVFAFSVCLSVCVSVCSRPVGHSFWPRGLIFGMKGPQGNHSKRIFLFFEILKFDLLMAIFRFFGSFLLYILY